MLILLNFENIRYKFLSLIFGLEIYKKNIIIESNLILYDNNNNNYYFWFG